MIKAAGEGDRSRGNREGLVVILPCHHVRIQAQHGPEDRDTERAVGLHEVWVGCACLSEGHGYPNIGDSIRISGVVVFAVLVLRLIVIHFMYENTHQNKVRIEY